MKRRNIGIDANRAAAIIAPSSVLLSKAKLEMYWGMVFILSLWLTSKGHRRLSHCPLKERMAKVAITGLQLGNTIFVKMPNSPIPSTRAASRNSLGKVVRYCFI